jgi:hypothetical protein
VLLVGALSGALRTISMVRERERVFPCALGTFSVKESMCFLVLWARFSAKERECFLVLWVRLALKRVFPCTLGTI